MVWQVEQAEAEEGKPAVMWFGTFPPIFCVLLQSGVWQDMQSPVLKV